MSQATAPQPALESSALEQLVAAGNALVARAADEIAHLRRDLMAAQAGTLPLTATDYLAGFARIRDIEFEIMENRRAVEDAATWRTLREMREEPRPALAPAPEPAVRHRHAKPRRRGERPPFPRAIGAAVPVGGLVAAMRGTARHMLPVHPVAAMKTAAFVGGTAAVVTVAATGTHTLEFRSPAPPLSAPGAIMWSATPIPSSPSRPDAYVRVLKTPKPRPMAVVTVPALPVVVPSPDSPSPDGSSSQDGSSQQDQSSQSSDWSQSSGDSSQQGDWSQSQDPSQQQGDGQQGDGGYQGRHRAPGAPDSGQQGDGWQHGGSQDGGHDGGGWHGGH